MFEEDDFTKALMVVGPPPEPYFTVDADSVKRLAKWIGEAENYGRRYHRGRCGEFLIEFLTWAEQRRKGA